MSLVRKVAGNTVIHITGKLLGNIIGVVVIALLTRYLGQEGFGNYTTILAYLFFFSSFADLGLYMITINEINKDGVNQSRFFSAVYSLRFFTAFILMIVASMLVWLMPYPDVVKQGVMVISVAIFFGLMDQIHIALYQAKISMTRTALADVVGKIILIIGTVIGIQLGFDLLQLLWVLVVGVGVNALINFNGIHRIVELRMRIDWDMWMDVLRKTWPIALSQFFVLIYFKMDTVFLSILRPAQTAQVEVGLYGAPYKFLEVLIAFIPLFMGIMAPILAKAWSKKRMEDFRALYQNTFDVFAVITLPLVVGGIVLAEPLMGIIAPGFEESVVILQMLMVAIGIIFFAHLPTYVVNTIGEQRNMLPFYGFTAVIAVVLYVVLIPRYSFYAAAGVTIFVELLILVFSWRRVHRVTGQVIKWRIFAKSALSALIMGLALWNFAYLNVFILLMFGGIVYFAVMFVIKGLVIDVVKDLLTKPAD